MKKLLLTAMLAVSVCTFAACSKKEPVEAPATTDVTAESTQPAEESAPDAAVEDAASAMTEDEVEAKNELDEKNAALEDAAVQDFAAQIKAAVSAKDAGALAELMSYPTYVMMEDGDQEIASKEDFLALDEAALFPEGFVKEIAEFDTTGMTVTGAGFIMGDNYTIIFGYGSDDKLGITGYTCAE